MFALVFTKKDHNFFSFSGFFFLFFFFFVNFKAFSIARPLIYYFIRHCNQLQYSDSPNSTYNWHVPNNWTGSTITAITFSNFITKRGLPGSSYDREKEDHNPLDHFLMGIIEEISFFFFDKEDAVRHQKTISRNDTNIEKQGERIRREKGYNLHRIPSTKFKTLFSVVLRDIFRT